MNRINYNLLAKIKLHKKDNPVYSIELEKQFEITGSEIRNAIRDLRRLGYPIANSSKGYFYAKDYSELKQTIEDLQSRCNSMHDTLNALKNIYKNEIQENLF